MNYLPLKAISGALEWFFVKNHIKENYFATPSFFLRLLKEQLKYQTLVLTMFEIELVKQCKANDRKAQLRLYQQYCDGMFAVAMRFLKNQDDAEDVLQESFIKAFQRMDQFKGEVTFGAWLKRIVVNGSIDFLKSKHQKTVELNEGYMHVTDDDDWTIEDGISIKKVKDAIEKLAEKYRYVIQLFLVEGYDHSEISQILGISETASRTRLLRGKTQLKEELKDIDYGTGS
nr:RNA polymerase sigma factor [uncultured Allomuricauda sp.]